MQSWYQNPVYSPAQQKKFRVCEIAAKMEPTAQEFAVTYVILSMSIYYKSTANLASHLSNTQMQFEGPLSV